MAEPQLGMKLYEEQTGSAEDGKPETKQITDVCRTFGERGGVDEVCSWG